MQRTMTLVLALLLLSTLACRDDGPLEESPESALAARRDVVRWLECEECTDGELEAVLALGQRAVPTLVATLGKGPSPARMERERIALEARYRALKAHVAANPRLRIHETAERYVADYLENLELLYRARSARALGVLGGQRAEAGLRSALSMDLPPESHLAIEDALERLEGP